MASELPPDEQNESLDATFHTVLNRLASYKVDAQRVIDLLEHMIKPSDHLDRLAMKKIAQDLETRQRVAKALGVSVESIEDAFASVERDNADAGKVFVESLKNQERLEVAKRVREWKPIMLTDLQLCLRETDPVEFSVASIFYQLAAADEVDAHCAEKNITLTDAEKMKVVKAVWRQLMNGHEYVEY